MQRTLILLGMAFVAGSVLVSSENTEKRSNQNDQFSNRHGEYNDKTYQTLWDAYYEAYPGSIRLL